MITYKWTQRRVVAGLASLAIITLQGCGGADTAMVDATGQTEITTPALLRTVAALDGDNLTLDVAVNDQVTVLTQTEPNLWTGTVNVPANRSSDVVVSWGQNYGTFGYLPLARQQKSVVVGADPGVVVFENGYNTAFDFDNDGMSNLVELEEGRSPVSFLDVTINVDGAFPTGLSLPGSNVCGARMPIAVVVEQLVTDAVVTPDDNIAWWCGLYLPESRNVLNEVTRLESIVLIVKVTDDILFVDSPTGQEYRDDSVEVFIDGDNSKRSSYDGANDFHFRFLPEGTGGVFLTRGPYLPENLTASVDYFTGGYQLTVTIPVQEVGIDNGQPFGLNIEVNDDDDGGGRDAKYSWVAAEGRDISWRNPSAFGTSQIP